MIKINAEYIESESPFFKFVVKDDSDAKESFLQMINEGLIFYLPGPGCEKFFIGSIHRKEIADTIFKDGFQIGLIFQIRIESKKSDDLSVYISNLGINNISVESFNGVSIFKF